MSPNAGERRGCGVSANEYSCTHGAQNINFGDLNPYLTKGSIREGKELEFGHNVRLNSKMFIGRW
jgi:hypothetical protein